MAQMTPMWTMTQTLAIFRPPCNIKQKQSMYLRRNLDANTKGESFHTDLQIKQNNITCAKLVSFKLTSFC